ncbi:MAG: hypothetical protein ABSE86_14555 [Bryobacteraceae bacterium]|jgi:hypothetical protein
MLTKTEQDACISALRRAYDAFNCGDIDRTVESLVPDSQLAEGRDVVSMRAFADRAQGLQWVGIEERG